MKIKIFGKELFAYHSRNSDYYAIPAINALKESKYLPDFRQTIDDGWSNPAISQGISGNWAIATDTRSDNAGGMVAIPIQNTPKTGAEKKEAKKLTPKKVYSLQMLYDKEFTVNMDPKYVDEQIKQFKDKLSLIKAEEYDMRRGTEEIASVLVRMENRKKYAKHAKFYSQYPYTTRARIQSVLGKHDYLKLGQVAQFVVQEADGRFRYVTALEAERLQGFPENWTAGRSEADRWFALGNAVNCRVSEYLFTDYLKGLWW